MAEAAGGAGVIAGAQSGAPTDSVANGGDQPNVQPGGATPPQPAAKAWYDGADPDTVNLINNKAWDSPLKAVESYKALEKIFGAEKAGAVLIPPKDDSPQAEKDAFYNKLGRPEKADGYKWDEKSSPELTTVFGEAFHKLGLTAAQQKGLEEIYNATANGSVDKETTEFVEKSAIELRDVQREYGERYNDEVMLAKKASNHLGWNADALTAVERVIGTKALMSGLIKMGQFFREAGAPNTRGETPGIVSGREAAQAKIASLKADPAFMARYLSPNDFTRKSAIAEMEDLNKILVGE